MSVENLPPLLQHEVIRLLEADKFSDAKRLIEEWNTFQKTKANSDKQSEETKNNFRRY